MKTKEDTAGVAEARRARGGQSESVTLRAYVCMYVQLDYWHAAPRQPQIAV